MSVSVKSGASQSKTDPPKEDEVPVDDLDLDKDMGEENKVENVEQNEGVDQKDEKSENVLTNTRRRAPTSKGRSYQLKTLIASMKSCRNRLKKQVGIIEDLLGSHHADLVANEMNALDKMYSDFSETYAKACTLLSTYTDDADDKEEEAENETIISKMMDENDNDYLDCKAKVCKALMQLERPTSKADSIRSGGSNRSGLSRVSSNRSRSTGARSLRSSSSRSSDMSLKQKAKIASLKAKADSLKKTREAELSAELLRLEMKIKEAEALEKVYQDDAIKDAELEDKKESKDKVMQKMPKDDTRSDTGRIINIIPSTPTPDSLKLQEAMVDMIKLQAAPKPDIDVFSGDPLEYLYFKANFKEVVESTVPDERGRLTRLIKYTDGEAKDLIKHLVHHADHNTCYTTAMRLLDKEYGNPHLLSCSYLKELRLWKKVEENDAAAFKKLYRFLLKCQAYKKDRLLMELDSTDMIKAIISKVHTTHQGRWSRRALDIRHKDAKEADFNDLVMFMGREAELLSDPAYSRNALSDVSVSSFSTRCTLKDQSSIECPICNGLHDIEDCDIYLQKDMDQRHKTVFQGGLCFGCLGEVGNDHVAKTCTKKRKCRVCSEEHPTTLHGGKSEKTFHTTIPSRTISMCVVPIVLWHKSHPEKKITVYALLDDSSTSTFIAEEVLDILEIDSSQTIRTSVDVTTAIGNREDPATLVSNLSAKCISLHSKVYPSPEVNLPVAFSRSSLAIDKEEVPTPARIKDWPHLKPLMDKIPEYDSSFPVGMIIGGDCPRGVEPLEVIQSTSDGPFAKRTRLGWCVVGPVAPAVKPSLQCYHTRATIPVKDVSTGLVANHCFSYSEPAQDDSITNTLKEMYSTEFNETASERVALSLEDEEFLRRMKSEGGRTEDGKHILPLPFRDKDVKLPSNREQVRNRLTGSLKRRLKKDKGRHKSYCDVMNWLISNYARKAETSQDTPGKVWYLPHFGVFNEEKEKLRVVFDAKAVFNGASLNQELLQGPDLTNLLAGVLLRFRKEDVAIMADIEAMFYQVMVPESQRSFLRFFWWKNGDLDTDPVEYEMCVHLFGAVSSGSCANYALKKTADASETEFGPQVAYTMRRNFYVDDLLKSLENVVEAKVLVKGIRNACAVGGFNLTKFISNSREVIESIPTEHRASSVVNLDLTCPLPIERALGVYWCVENDTLGFRITLKDTPLTKRSILGTISSFYDPNGLASPFVLPARKVLQKITKQGGSWDDPVTDEIRAMWERWRIDIPDLQNLQINRCFKTPGFKAASVSLHCFSDASEYGYGQASYLRQVSASGEVCVTLVMAKSRVTPVNHPTIPRLELTAALTSAKVAAFLLDELDIPDIAVVFWVDSMIVLGYLQNSTKRYRTYVANRTRKIRELTGSWPWTHVNQDQNPADDASRGLSARDTTRVHRWLNGPAFLKEAIDPTCVPIVQAKLAENDPEVIISVTTNATITKRMPDILDTLGTRISSWVRMKRTIATAMKFVNCCRQRKSWTSPIMVEDVMAAETLMITFIQEKHFAEEMRALRSNKNVKQSSRLLALDPFLDEKGVVRVGGRLRECVTTPEIKHPIILPKKEIVVRRLIEWCHREVQHLGRTSTLGEIRSRGYWIMGANGQVRQVVNWCVPCKILRGQPLQQKMSDLPENRTSSTEPFVHCGVDLFGPFEVKEGRKEVNRYGILFTCFGCRAIHLEMTKNMDTDSFILSLRRFIGRRGPVRSIRSDNGGNFVGADNEMKRAMKEIDQEKVKEFLMSENCDWDWVDWERNPAHASHMGGVWERQIRSCRNVLTSLLNEHKGRLNDESLRTLFVEVECIVNSRPLTVDTLSDETVEPLTPNHLLTMKSRVVLPPPGVFQRADIYCRKRWRAVQYLANQFWSRWRKEFVLSLQERQKWTATNPNVEVGDIVLVIDKDSPRNQWPLGRIVTAPLSADGLVRKVEVKVAGHDKPLSRPISKLIPLVRNCIKS